MREDEKNKERRQLHVQSQTTVDTEDATIQIKSFASVTLVKASNCGCWGTIDKSLKADNVVKQFAIGFLKIDCDAVTLDLCLSFLVDVEEGLLFPILRLAILRAENDVDIVWINKSIGLFTMAIVVTFTLSDFHEEEEANPTRLKSQRRKADRKSVV